MNTDEIVRALRDAEGNNELDCEISELRPLLLKAANLIESMQARLVEYDEVAAEYGLDGETMLTLAKSQIRTAQDNIKLREQLAASQCRAQDARNELCLKCGKYHEAHNGSCDGCRWKEG